MKTNVPPQPSPEAPTRWAMLSRELQQVIEQVERGELDQLDAEQRVGELTLREARALGAKPPRAWRAKR